MKKTIWCVLFVLGCGATTEPETTDGSSNNRETPVNNENNGKPFDCETIDLSPMSVSEGGRLKVPKYERWSFEYPEAFRIAEEESRFLIKPPYGETGEFTIAVNSECGDETSVTLTVHPLSWRAISRWNRGTPDHPGAREHAAMWALNKTLYVAHGFAYEPQQFTPTFDAWTLDLESGVWTEANQSGEVPQTTGGRVAIANERVYLSGGSIEDGSLPDSFYRARVDGADIEWENLTASSSGGGGARILGTFAYDQKGERFISMHGIGLTGIFSRTQTTISTAPDWRVVATENDPSARYGTFFGMEQEYRRLVVFSGAQGLQSVDPAHDTWVLQVGDGIMQWTQVAQESTPQGRRNGCYGLDSENLRFFVHGGTPDGAVSATGLWVLDLEPGHEVWERVDVSDGPAPRSSCSSFYDPETEAFYMGFGNSDLIYHDIWALDLGTGN